MLSSIHPVQRSIFVFLRTIYAPQMLYNFAERIFIYFSMDLFILSIHALLNTSNFSKKLLHLCWEYPYYPHQYYLSYFSLWCSSEQ